MTRFRLSLLDNDDDDSDAEDYENEPPHPLGFSPGRSRYTFSTTDDDYDDDKPYDSDDNDNNNDNTTTSTWTTTGDIQEQMYPPVSSYSHVNTLTSPMKALVRHALESNAQQRRVAARCRDDDDGGSPAENVLQNNDIDNLTRALRDGTMFGSLSSSNTRQKAFSPTLQSLASSTSTTTCCQLLPTAYASLAREEARISQDMISTQQRFEREHLESARNVQALLDANQQRAEQKQASMEKRQQELQDQQAAEQQAQEDHLEAQRQDEQRTRDALEKQHEKNRLVQVAKEDAKRAEDAKKRAATEYITRADKLIAQLKQLRASVEPFETSKPMGKRRLAMKKVVNGRVNTLSEDVGKIRAVANDVSNAIATSRQEDEQYKAQIDAGNQQPELYTPEMARGKRYFLDLLSSKVVVRVQAEGFNGQRGDGFPLAAMLAAIAVDNKDLVPVLTAHIYTVCPTAIPKLPTPSPDATEEELMESLGMIKGKNGEFETFARFLSRTEGLISMVADIMSSEPSAHTLFGGHEGAVKWLARFLSQLPPAPQSPLPLFTAPVLDAFLMGAGHMLANKHPEDFKKHLSYIIDDCLPRIDEGTIGKPSATRLKKTIQGHFDGFKNKLPGRALAELYYGANSTGSSATPSSFSNIHAPVGSSSMGGVSARPSPFGTTPAPASAPNPFNAPSTSTTAPNPFGGGSTTTANATTAAPSPFFGVTSSTPASTPFGSSTSSSQNEPFGGGQQSSTPNHPFGGGGTSTPFGSPFGGTTTAPAPIISAPIPSPFGPGLQISPSPFGGGIAPAPAPFATNVASPFGNSNAPAAASPFAPASATGGSIFGNAPASGGFGAPAPGVGLFGAPTPGGFGFGAAPAPAPFGAPSTGGGMYGNPAPAPSTAFGTSAPSISSFGASFGAPPASAAQQSPFGGGGFGVSSAAAAAPSQQSPFGLQPSPFGVTAPSPFGTAASSPSPFGTAAPSPSPFGTAAPAPSPFGTFGSAGNGQFGGGSGNNNKPPCRFFAQGTCKYGSNCRFSHDTAVGGGGAFNSAPSTFNSAPSPFSNFGGPRY